MKFNELYDEAMSEARVPSSQTPEEIGRDFFYAMEELQSAINRALKKGDPAVWAEKYSKSAKGSMEIFDRLVKSFSKM